MRRVATMPGGFWRRGMRQRLTRRSAMALAVGGWLPAASLPMAAWGQTVGGQPAGGQPIVVGVSGPLTGQYAQYGADWQRGFDLAVGAVNAGGGMQGRPLRVQFEDSQADPRQAVAIAQKFVQDPRVVIELGDFSSAAS